MSFLSKLLLGLAVGGPVAIVAHDLLMGSLCAINNVVPGMVTCWGTVLF